MAVYHMVWIKFNDGVSEERKAEHMAALNGMKGKVAAIDSVVAGENFTDRANGFTHGLIVEVADRDALPAYIQDEHHVSVATPLKEDAQLMAMDIEV